MTVTAYEILWKFVKVFVPLTIIFTFGFNVFIRGLIYYTGGINLLKEGYFPKTMNEFCLFYLKSEFILEINLENMPMKKFYNYHYIGLTVISTTEEFIQDKNCFFLKQEKIWI